MVRSISFIALILLVMGCVNSQPISKYEGDIGVKVDGTCRLVDAHKSVNLSSAYDPYTLAPENHIQLQVGETYYCTVEGLGGSWIRIDQLIWDIQVRISYCLKGSDFGSMVVTYQNLQETLAKEPEKWSTNPDA